MALDLTMNFLSIDQSTERSTITEDALRTSKHMTSTEVNPKAERNKWDNKPGQTHHSTRFASLLPVSDPSPLHKTITFREHLSCFTYFSSIFSVSSLWLS
jgi:hypothetical protein